MNKLDSFCIKFYGDLNISIQQVCCIEIWNQEICLLTKIVIWKFAILDWPEP